MLVKACFARRPLYYLTRMAVLVSGSTPGRWRRGRRWIHQHARLLGGEGLSQQPIFYQEPRPLSTPGSGRPLPAVGASQSQRARRHRHLAGHGGRGPPVDPDPAPSAHPRTRASRASGGDREPSGACPTSPGRGSAAVSAGFGGWPPSFGQRPAFPPRGVEKAGLPVTEGRHTAAGVTVPAGTAGTGQVEQRRSAPLTESGRHRHNLPVPLHVRVTKPAPSEGVLSLRDHVTEPVPSGRDRPETAGLDRACALPPVAEPHHRRSHRRDVNTARRPWGASRPSIGPANPRVSYPKRLKSPVSGQRVGA
jgi:hypothetical protein